MKKKIFLIAATIFALLLITSLSYLEEKGVSMRKPRLNTLDDLKIFVMSDKTNENKWVKDKYMCWNFTKDFINNAFQEGFICFPYVIEKHAKVICEVREGFAIIEPQNDDIFILFKNNLW